MLSVVIKAVKGIEHDKFILNSHNEIKTTWGIINKGKGRCNLLSLFFSSTTLYEFWLAQLFRSIASSCALCFQFTPIFLSSFLTSSSHLNLGFPFGLVAYGFHLYMVLATLSLSILSTCPNQLNLLLLMCLTIFS